MRVLIVGEADSRTALAAVRGLGRAGWLVGVGSAAPGSLSAASRWTRHLHRVPPPELDVRAFLDAVNQAIARVGYDLVIGVDDASVMALSASRAAIQATVPYGAHDAVLAATDKLRLGEIAARAGFRTPRTVAGTSGNLDAWTGPAVVKCRMHWRPARRGPEPRLEATLVPGPAEAARRVEQILRTGGEPMLQEVVTGQLMAFVAVVDQGGRLVARLQQRAERTWPVPTGVSVRATTVPVDPELAKRAAVLLEDLGWFGLVQLQFLAADESDPWLIDVNGRPYGSLSLAHAAGLNPLDIWARLATGRPVPGKADAAAGVRYQWLEGDLRRACSEHRGGLLADVADCLRHAPGAAHSVASFTDPWPGFRYTGHLAVRLARKLRRTGGEAEP
jgi:predicted ATP-grasp superfamily ATP-dependent carboligase